MDTLGDRMKAYEGVSNLVLPERTPVVVRVDGKAFHTVTRGLDKPWDARVTACMDATAMALMEEMQNAVAAYVQSDEISILMINYAGEFTQSWFGNKVQKIVSVASSVATHAFNETARGLVDLESRRWLFDARAFTLPRHEVSNYFIWRQQDAIRNSVSALARSKFTHRELQGKPCKAMKEMLESIGVKWEDCATRDKMGRLIVRTIVGDNKFLDVYNPTPNFVAGRKIFEKLVNVGETQVECPPELEVAT
jgi:tRNA(His) guanylyltransferase